MSDNTASFNFGVNGLLNQRTLQDFVKGDLPIKVKVEATLDGQPISPNDIVGKSGLLKMTYTITNDTAVDQEIIWKDGLGETQTKTVSVPIPYVGSFTTVLSDSYANIVAPAASMGGTGRNSTQLSYNLLLYKPLGDTTAVVTYEAKVTNADIPTVDMTFLPAGPAENPSTKSLQEQIKGGADSGAQITDAGSQIDANLLKLAAGAGALNAGLAKLYAGSQTLATGLTDTAVPGAKKVAAGAVLVSGGTKKASSGANQLAAGSAQVAGGATQVADGSAQLDAGLATFQDGVTQLQQGVATLPTSITSQPGYQQLKGALAAVQAGIGSTTSTSSSTLEGGMNLIRAGLDNPALNFPTGSGPCNPAAAQGATGYCGLKDALQLLSFGLSNVNCVITDPLNPANPCGAVQGVGAVESSLADASAAGGALDQLIGAAKGVYAQSLCPAAAPGTTPVSGVYPPSVLVGPLFNLSPTGVCVLQSNVIYGLGLPAGVLSPTDLGGVKAQSAAGAAALANVNAGLTGQALPAIAQMIAGIGADATANTLLNGTARVKVGLNNPACNPADPTNPANPCGIYQVQALVSAGIDQLVAEISGTIAGAIGTAPSGCDPTATLACASAALGAGAADLSTGATQVAGGADQVAAGSAELNSGLDTLDNGAQKLAAGATQLATGLQPAAQGATTIAIGVGTVVIGCDPTATLSCGASAIEDGANKLSAQGSKVLIAKGNDTTNAYGEQYALMEALNKRSLTQAGIPNGPAKGQDVVTTGAFGYTLQGVSQADSTNGIRFLLAGLLLAGAVGVGVAFSRN